MTNRIVGIKFLLDSIIRPAMQERAVRIGGEQLALFLTNLQKSCGVVAERINDFDIGPYNATTIDQTPGNCYLEDTVSGIDFIVAGTVAGDSVYIYDDTLSEWVRATATSISAKKIGTTDFTGTFITTKKYFVTRDPLFPIANSTTTVFVSAGLAVTRDGRMIYLPQGIVASPTVPADGDYGLYLVYKEKSEPTDDITSFKPILGIEVDIATVQELDEDLILEIRAIPTGEPDYYTDAVLLAGVNISGGIRAIDPTNREIFVIKLAWEDGAKSIFDFIKYYLNWEGHGDKFPYKDRYLNFYGDAVTPYNKVYNAGTDTTDLYFHKADLEAVGYVWNNLGLWRGAQVSLAGIGVTAWLIADSIIVGIDIKITVGGNTTTTTTVRFKYVPISPWGQSLTDIQKGNSHIENLIFKPGIPTTSFTIGPHKDWLKVVPSPFDSTKVLIYGGKGYDTKGRLIDVPTLGQDVVGTGDDIILVFDKDLSLVSIAPSSILINATVGGLAVTTIDDGSNHFIDTPEIDGATSSINYTTGDLHLVFKPFKAPDDTTEIKAFYLPGYTSFPLSGILTAGYHNVVLQWKEDINGKDSYEFVIEPDTEHLIPSVEFTTTGVWLANVYVIGGDIISIEDKRQALSTYYNYWEDLDYIMKIFKTSIYSGGIPTFDFTSDPHKDYLKVEDHSYESHPFGWFEVIRVLAGSCVDGDGHYMHFDTTSDDYLLNDIGPVPGTFYVYVQYVIGGDGKPSQELHVETSPGPSDSIPLATVYAYDDGPCEVVDTRPCLCYYHKKVAQPNATKRLRAGWQYLAEGQTNMILEWEDYIDIGKYTIDVTRTIVTVNESRIIGNGYDAYYLAHEHKGKYLQYTIISGESGEFTDVYYTEIEDNDAHTITVKDKIITGYLGGLNIVPYPDCSFRIHIQELKLGTPIGTITKHTNNSGLVNTDGTQQMYPRGSAKDGTSMPPTPTTLSLWSLTDWESIGIWTASQESSFTHTGTSDVKTLTTCNPTLICDPNKVYRIRIATMLDMNTHWWSAWSNWVIIAPKTPPYLLTNILVPKTADFTPIEIAQGGLIFWQRIFQTERWDGIDVVHGYIDGFKYYWGATEVFWKRKESATIKIALTTDTIEYATLSTITIPVGEFPSDFSTFNKGSRVPDTTVSYGEFYGAEIFLHLNPAEVALIKVRFRARDGTAGTTKILAMNGLVSDTAPSGDQFPRGGALKSDMIAGISTYPKTNLINHTIFAEVIEARGQYSKLEYGVAGGRENFDYKGRPLAALINAILSYQQSTIIRVPIYGPEATGSAHPGSPSADWQDVPGFGEKRTFVKPAGVNDLVVSCIFYTDQTGIKVEGRLGIIYPGTGDTKWSPDVFESTKTLEDGGQEIKFFFNIDANQAGKCSVKLQFRGTVGDHPPATAPDMDCLEVFATNITGNLGEQPIIT